MMLEPMPPKISFINPPIPLKIPPRKFRNKFQIPLKMLAPEMVVDVVLPVDTTMR
jgi:hypothetical protein